MGPSEGSNMKALMLYVTCADQAEAKKLARLAVESHLAACANILGSPIESLYFWQGQLEESQENLLLLKTTEELFEPLTKLIRQEHSYQTPCIVALPIVAADADYLKWIKDSCSKAKLN